MEKYSKCMVRIHWIHAALIAFVLLSGGLILSEMPNNVDKIGSLKGHMILGALITVITFVRLFKVSKHHEMKPLEVGAGREQIIKWNHRLIYLMLIVVGLSGMIAANTSGLGDIVFFGKEAELYADATSLSKLAGSVHAVATKLLMALIVMHVAGIISYMIKTKENVLKRMWF
jgi:cytochrome b561